jgi:ferredoxin-NADP reductase
MSANPSVALYPWTIHLWIIRTLGRERLDYLISNTMNTVTEKISRFFWSYDCKAKIMAIRRETADTLTFELLPNQHFKQPLPGQHVEIKVAIAPSGEVVTRCYTLSHIQDDTVAITVKRQAGGKLSCWLHDQARVGDILTISSPRGQFNYHGQRKLVFICAGSGITPCFAILNALRLDSRQPDIGFFYRTTTPENAIFRQSLEHLSGSQKIVFSYSRQPVAGVSEKPLAEQLMDTFPDLNERHIFLCGPQGFHDAVVDTLTKIGFDFNYLTVEKFSSQAHSFALATNLSEDITVTLKSQNVSFRIRAQDSHKTLLESAESQGVHLEHGCRSGMCGTCRTHLLEGRVTGNQLGKSIYPCTAYPASTSIVLE